MVTIHRNGRDCKVATEKYGRGRVAVLLVDALTDERVETVSANLSDAPFWVAEPNEVVIVDRDLQTLLENAGILQPNPNRNVRFGSEETCTCWVLL